MGLVRKRAGAGSGKKDGNLTEGPIGRGLFRFMIPIFLGQLLQQLYNMADTIIVGRYVGAGALAAVGSTGTIMFLATGFAQGITAGFSILTAQRYGAGDEKGVKRSGKRNDPGGDRSGHPDTGLCGDHEPAFAPDEYAVRYLSGCLHVYHGNQRRTHGKYLLQPVFLLSAGGGKQSDPTLFPDIFRLPERGSGSAFYHPRRHGCGRSSLGDESVPGDLGGALRGIYLG